jgi:hypothetical protein
MNVEKKDSEGGKLEKKLNGNCEVFIEFLMFVDWKILEIVGEVFFRCLRKHEVKF